MMDNKNIPAVDQSWSEAEKMLDKHFKKKRMIVLFFSIIIPAFIVGLTLMIGHSKKMAENNIATTAPTVVSTPSLVEKNVIKNTTINSIVEKPNSKLVATKKTSALSNNSSIKPERTENHKVLITSNNSIDKKTITDKLPIESKSTFNKNSNIVYKNAANPSDMVSVTSGKKSSSNENNFEPIAFLSPVSMNFDFYHYQNAISENLGLNPGKADENSSIGWAASLYGGANYIQKILSTMNDWDNYLMHRKNEEDAVIAPFIGMSISGNLNSLGFNLGIEFSQYGEKTNYYPYSNQLTYFDNSNWQTYLRSIVDTDTAYITGNQYFLQTTFLRLDSSYIVDSDTIEEYKYDQKIAETNGYTRIYYVEMPIEISYRVSKGKLGLGFSGGISPAMRIQQNGYYLRPDGRGVESLKEIESFRTFLLNARMSVDLYYRAGDRLNLIFRPQFRTNLNSVFKDDYGVKQKYYSTGVLFGVSYMLN